MIYDWNVLIIFNFGVVSCTYGYRLRIADSYSSEHDMISNARTHNI